MTTPPEVMEAIKDYLQRHPEDDLVEVVKTRDLKTIEVWEIRFEERGPKVKETGLTPMMDGTEVPTFVLKPTKVLELRIRKPKK